MANPLLEWGTPPGRCVDEPCDPPRVNADALAQEYFSDEILTTTW